MPRVNTCYPCDAQRKPSDPTDTEVARVTFGSRQVMVRHREEPR
jgi:hypothetical protein